MIYPFNCLLYTYDLYISSPELSPGNQNQSTSNSTGSTELFISSPNIFFLCFLNLPNGTTIYSGTQGKHWVIFSALTPFPHTFWLHVPFVIARSDTHHLFLYLLWWTPHWPPFFGQWPFSLLPFRNSMEWMKYLQVHLWADSIIEQFEDLVSSFRPLLNAFV